MRVQSPPGQGPHHPVTPGAPAPRARLAPGRVSRHSHCPPDHGGTALGLNKEGTAAGAASSGTGDIVSTSLLFGFVAVTCLRGGVGQGLSVPALL